MAVKAYKTYGGESGKFKLVLLSKFGASRSATSPTREPLAAIIKQKD